MRNTITNLLKNKHFRNFKGFIFGGIVAIILGYVGNFLINKNLTKEDMGLFSYYYNLFVLLTTIFSVNIYTSYLRFNLAGFNRLQLKRNVKLISIFATILLAIVIIILTENALASTFAFLILFNERTYFFRSEKAISKMNNIKYLSSVILIIGLLLFIQADRLSFDTALISYGIGYIISVLIGYLFDNKNEEHHITKETKPLPIRKILKYTIPVTLAAVVSWFSHVSDQIVMKNFLTLSELGTYAISYRIIVIVQIFTSLFLMYYPMLYFEEADKNNFVLINKIRKLFILILLFFTLLLIFGRRFVYIVLGASHYLEFTDIFIYLIIAEFIRIIAGLYLSFRSYTLQTHYSLYAIAIPTIIQLVLNIIFIPKYGLYFAAYTQLASALLYFIITIFTAIKPERKYFIYDR